MGSQSHRGPAGLRERVALPLEATLRARLLRRYKRFLADVECEDGGVLTVHCPNPGSMLGCATPNSAVRCSTSDNPKRRLRHTLEMIRVGRTWVGVHTLRANQIARRALERGAITALRDYSEVRPEFSLDGGTRLDFRLSGHANLGPAYVEVKSVTLADGSHALFPDSVTARGRRHAETLMRLRQGGARAIMLFIVQRADCEDVSPADDIDPAYGQALREAASAGVEVLALRARVTARAIRLERGLPVRL